MSMGGMQKTIKLNVNVADELWPYQVVDEIQKVMEEGLEKHSGKWWLRQSVKEHVECAFLHVQHVLNEEAVLENGKREDHLAHAFCRLMMAMAIERGYTKGDEDA